VRFSQDARAQKRLGVFLCHAPARPSRRTTRRSRTERTAGPSAVNPFSCVVQGGIFVADVTSMQTTYLSVARPPRACATPTAAPTHSTAPPWPPPLNSPSRVPPGPFKYPKRFPMTRSSLCRRSLPGVAPS
jgi:hypothetical protein